MTSVLVTLQRDPPLTRIFAPTRVRAVDADDAQRRRVALREDGRREPSRTCADDDEVCRFLGRVHQHSLI